MNQYPELAALLRKQALLQKAADLAADDFQLKQYREVEARQQLTRYDQELTAAVTEDAYRAANTKAEDANTKHRWAIREVYKAQIARDKAHAALKPAEEAVNTEIDKILVTEAKAIAADIDRRLDDVDLLRKSLSVYVGDGITGTYRHQIAHAVASTLERLPRRDDVYIPVKILRGDPALVAGDTSGSDDNQKYIERRAALIATAYDTVAAHTSERAHAEISSSSNV